MSMQTLDKSELMKHEWVAVELRKRITHGVYAHKLPGERVFADEFAVNFQTIRKAMQPLVDDGLIERVSGKGSFVMRKRALTNTIAIVMHSFAGPLHTVIIRSIEAAAARQGLNLLFKAVETDPRPLAEIFKSFTASGTADGIICWGPGYSAMAAGLPCVSVMSDADVSSEPCSTVNPDDFHGGQLAVRHLLNLGHRKIGFVLPQGDTSLPVKERLAAYNSCMESAGLQPYAPVEVPGEWRRINRVGPLRESPALLDRLRRFSALFCFNDALAGSVFKYLADHGISIPDDISVVGCDDTEFAWALGLTTIQLPVERIGEKAVELLVERVRDDQVDNEHISYPPELIARSSTARLGTSAVDKATAEPAMAMTV